jgi:hypothetical protein
MVEIKLDDNLTTITSHDLRLMPSKMAVKRIYDIILMNASYGRMSTEFTITEKNSDISYILNQLTDLFPGVEFKKIDKKYPHLNSCRYCYQNIKCHIHPNGPIKQTTYKASWINKDINL